MGVYRRHGLYDTRLLVFIRLKNVWNAHCFFGSICINKCQQCVRRPTLYQTNVSKHGLRFTSEKRTPGNNLAIQNIGKKVAWSGKFENRTAPLPCFLVLSVKHQTEVLFLDYKMFCPFAVFVRTQENIPEFCQTITSPETTSIAEQTWIIPARFLRRQRVTSFLRYRGCIATVTSTCWRVC